MNTPAFRVLVVDDHASVREGITHVINDEADMEVVGDAGNGPEALRLTEELLPMVVLTDVSMPGWSGVKVTQMIAHACPGVKVVGVSRHREPGFVRAMFDAGAAGYVLKQSPSSELPRAVRAVAAGSQYLDPGLGKGADSFTRPAKMNVGSDGPLLDADDERVLRLAASSHSNQEIAQTLAMDVRAVAHCKTHGMQTLGVASRVQLLEYAVACGWQERS